VEVDVAVIGAGPAGSTLAALLAARGRSVALIDRDSFPRDKLCGEFLSYDALPLLDELGVLAEIDARGAPQIARCRVVGARRRYEFDFPTPARGVSRFFLDDLLFRTAIQRGATAITGSAGLKAAANDDERRRSVTVDDTIVRPRIIAGAWGRWGRFDQQLGRAFVHDRSHRHFGFKRHYRGRSDRDVIELYSFHRGYLGVSNVESDIVNVCGLVHADRLTNHKGRWDSFVETLRDEEQRLDVLYGALTPAQENFLSSEPVIFRARSAVEHNIFMIGDASGVIDPLTGNGMAMAIQSAFAAAPFIERVLGGENRANVENEYRERHRALFASRIKWSRRVAFLLSRPALIDAALAGLRTRAIGQFFLRKTRAR
jgi:flavin-dependent dehydrogenase